MAQPAFAPLVNMAMPFIFVAATFLMVGAMLSDIDAYTLSTAELLQNSEVRAALGTPISTGTPLGNFEVSGPDGSAHFQFSVRGPLAKGIACVEATKSLGQWKLVRMAVDEEPDGQRITVK